MSAQSSVKDGAEKASEVKLNKQNLEVLKAGDFMMRVLNGLAVAIVVGLIPNAILGEIFKALMPYGSVWNVLYQIVSGVQFTVPALVGAMVGLQFKMTPIELGSLSLTTFIASGVASFTAEGWRFAGIGDLINTLIVAVLGVLLIRFLHGRLGSLTMILLPPLVSVIVGGVGLFLLPYSVSITQALGHLILHFTTLQPLLMSILLAVSFAIIIVSPVSTVAIALAVGLTGLASGAANIGIASCAMTLAVGSAHVNKSGVTLAVVLGSMKLYMPNWLRHPIMNLPIILNAILAGVTAWLFNLQGTAKSAGFGFSGLVGPINAYHFMTQAPAIRLLYLFLAYFVITFVGAFLIDLLCVKVLKLYDHKIFEFQGSK
ncbi:MAG: PTS transporter subunit IIC [Eubacteriales bacterium]|nr:PTS transporter subunit IIC [Eubacteriales bacterium]